LFSQLIISQVYLPAISGLVLDRMVRCFAALLEFCYLVRCNTITETTLESMSNALDRFHTERAVFMDEGVRFDFNLPRQHSLVHYLRNIQLFGAPNGLCSSITESKHIKAVKEPWCRSNHYNALGQMLLTCQRLDKLSALYIYLVSRNLLLPNVIPQPVDPHIEPPVFGDPDAVQVQGPRVMNVVTLAVRRGVYFYASTCDLRALIQIIETGYPLQLEALAAQLDLPLHVDHICRFLFDQLYPNAPLNGDEVDIAICPNFNGNIHVFHSALATFYAPSDPSGIGGMHCQRIRATPSWRREHGRYDCMLVAKDSNLPGFCGLHAVQVRLFFSFKHDRKTYPCALVQWFSPVGDEPCEDTGMWIVEPDQDVHGRRPMSILHLDSAIRSVHLLPVYGSAFIPHDLHYSETLCAFRRYYINKYADHHMHEIAF
jgi:hypothetical protein